MVIYGDVLVLLNLAVDYALLLTCARIAACPFLRWRLMLGALFGALYALGVFLPGLGWLGILPVRLAAGGVMALIAYGPSHRFLRQLGVLAGVSAALGGCVLALTQVGQATLYGGVVTTGADLTAVLLAGAGGCTLLTLCFRRRAAHLGALHYVWVELALNGRRARLRALVDTGNGLTDRDQNRVILAEAAALNPLLPPEGRCGRTELAAPALGFERLNHLLGPGRVRLVSYRAVGVSEGLLLALRPDLVRVDGTPVPGALVAFAPQTLSDDGSYQGLVGPEENGGWR